MERYQNRQEAGKVLASMLQTYRGQKDVIVLALPRGGVPVAYEIAKSLHAPLDVFIVRKLGVPWQEELAFGALAAGNVTVFNEDIVRDLEVSPSMIQQVIAEEKKELERREHLYRGKRPFPDLAHKTVILVDDGIATGATMRVAIKALRQLNTAKIIAAVPVAEVNTCENMQKLVDLMVCPIQPESFYAVGAWYESFPQTSDDEVRTLLDQARL